MTNCFRNWGVVGIFGMLDFGDLRCVCVIAVRWKGGVLGFRSFRAWGPRVILTFLDVWSTRCSDLLILLIGR